MRLRSTGWPSLCRRHRPCPLRAGSFTSPHTPDGSLVSDTCAICHRAHVAQGPVLSTSASPQSSLCFTCHDDAGSGSDLNTQAQFPVTPSRTCRDRRRHAKRATSAMTPPAPRRRLHTRWPRGTSSRACSTGTPSARTATTRTTRRPTPRCNGATGGSVSGRQNRHVRSRGRERPGRLRARVTRSSVGTVGSQPDREYQICLKCHSGFTTLTPAQDPSSASTWALDKAIELNPVTDHRTRTRPTIQWRQPARTGRLADGLEPGELVAVQAVELPG